MDVKAKGNNPGKKFEVLNDFTPGEYFARVLIPKIVDILSSKLDIRKMNDICRQQALLGQKLSKADVCVICKKDNKDKNFLKCKICVKAIHVKSCALKYIGKDNFNQAKEDTTNYKCDECSFDLIESEELVEHLLFYMLMMLQLQCHWLKEATVMRLLSVS